ncbi:hypothetical protein [Piscinibacter gummiphilus]|uniref:Uncharacterized protein n=1 Tax=Piscinibacter gummiphilus TaxID=946333 RepID=A0ABZ0D213_9BURK|nr:hypothetical protein [Piscinibacter gummiphilus]WOB11238.1 hypothetical protein RXV79_26770 [Piscinibacter gummiphilus]
MNLHIGATSANVPLVLLATSSPEERTQRLDALRRAHLAVGVDRRYLDLPPGHRLWALYVQVDTTDTVKLPSSIVHSHEYAAAGDEAGAIAAVRSYYREVAPAAAVLVVSARLASVERPEELAFPENVRRSDMPAIPLMRTLSS